MTNSQSGNPTKMRLLRRATILSTAGKTFTTVQPKRLIRFRDVRLGCRKTSLPSSQIRLSCTAKGSSSKSSGKMDGRFDVSDDLITSTCYRSSLTSLPMICSVCKICVPESHDQPTERHTAAPGRTSLNPSLMERSWSARRLMSSTPSGPETTTIQR